MQLNKCYQVNDAMNTDFLELLLPYAAKVDKLSSSITLGDRMKYIKQKVF